MRYSRRLVSSCYRHLPYTVLRAGYRLARPERYRQLQEFRRERLAPFDARQCLYVHIPKTAGISVASAIFGDGVGWHQTVRPYQKMYSRDEYDALFKFAFVRNPYTRTVSAYRYLQNGKIRSKDDIAWAESVLPNFPSFDAFVRGWLTRENALTQIHFYPQHRFVSAGHDDNLDVDFIGHFESLHEDFRRICNHLGLGSEYRLEHLNRSGESVLPDYAEYYTGESRRIVADVYAEDFRIFGYDPTA